MGVRRWEIVIYLRAFFLGFGKGSGDGAQGRERLDQWGKARARKSL